MTRTVRPTSAGARALLALALVVMSVFVVEVISPLLSKALAPLTTTQTKVYFEGRDATELARAAEKAAGDDAYLECNPATGRLQGEKRVRCTLVVRGGHAVAETHAALMRIRSVEGLEAARSSRPINYVYAIPKAPRLAYHLVFLSLALALSVALGWRPLTRIEFGKLFSKEAGFVVFLVCLPLNVAFLTSVVFRRLLPESWRIDTLVALGAEPLESMIPSSEPPMYFVGTLPEAAIPMSVALLLLGPLAEELVYRAMVLRILLSWYSPWLALGLSASAFAAAHGFLWPEFTAQLFLSGLAYGWLWIRTRSLLLCVVAHALCNFMGVFKSIQAIDWSL